MIENRVFTPLKYIQLHSILVLKEILPSLHWPLFQGGRGTPYYQHRWDLVHFEHDNQIHSRYQFSENLNETFINNLRIMSPAHYLQRTYL